MPACAPCAPSGGDSDIGVAKKTSFNNAVVKSKAQEIIELDKSLTILKNAEDLVQPGGKDVIVVSEAG